MSYIVAIAGSPAEKSKSTDFLRRVLNQVEEQGFSTKLLSVRDIPPHELIFGAGQDSSHLQYVTEHIELAAAVVIATPVYKAAYSGALKAFLDLLPQKALAGKVILPIMTAGSDKHLLAIDYALKPVLSALGATHVLSGFFVSDQQVQRDPFGLLLLDDATEQRLNEQVEALVASAGLVIPQHDYEAEI
ncbi:MAG: NADPH-dependent FMN reductase [Methylobacter sp.]